MPMAGRGLPRNRALVSSTRAGLRALGGSMSMPMWSGSPAPRELVPIDARREDRLHPFAASVIIARTDAIHV